MTTVLIAEDDPLICEVLSSMIAPDDGLELVGAAGNTHDAIAMTLELRPDLVLLDVEMPGGGGPAAARTIAAVCPEIRIVAISAHSDKEHVISMVNEGASGYVVKGADPAQVRDTIHRCARGETVFMPQSASTMMRDTAMLARAMEAAEIDRHERIERLEQICESDAIETVFQPIADLHSGRLFAVEALARFPQHGEMNTGQWFEEAIELGMTSQLELAALRNAADTFSRGTWGDFPVSINLSPTTLLEPELPALIADVESNLIVEITEHQRIDDYDAVLAARERLAARGVRVAIDDTGAGFASLRHILTLAPDLVKLDISITKDVDLDESRRALANGLCTFVGEIGATVVAEGIERGGELDCMRKLGVQYGQGWHISRPCSIDQLAQLDPHLI